MEPRTIILFSTDPHDRAAARELVTDGPRDIEEFDSAEAALASLLTDPCAVALVDLDAPGAPQILAALRADATKARMPVLGASRREAPDGAGLCDHLETGARPFLTIAIELALALEEVEAVRAGQAVRADRTAEAIGVVRAVGEESVVVHLFEAGRRTIPLCAVERVEGDAIIVDGSALRGELGEAIWRGHDDDEPARTPRAQRAEHDGDAPARSAMRKKRPGDKARLASQRQHPRFRPHALLRFATRLAQRWASATSVEGGSDRTREVGRAIDGTAVRQAA